MRPSRCPRRSLEVLPSLRVCVAKRALDRSRPSGREATQAVAVRDAFHRCAPEGLRRTPSFGWWRRRSLRREAWDPSCVYLASDISGPGAVVSLVSAVGRSTLLVRLRPASWTRSRTDGIEEGPPPSPCRSPRAARRGSSSRERGRCFSRRRLRIPTSATLKDARARPRADDPPWRGAVAPVRRVGSSFMGHVSRLSVIAIPCSVQPHARPTWLAGFHRVALPERRLRADVLWTDAVRRPPSVRPLVREDAFMERRVGVRAHFEARLGSAACAAVRGWEPCRLRSPRGVSRETVARQPSGGGTPSWRGAPFGLRSPPASTPFRAHVRTGDMGRGGRVKDPSQRAFAPAASRQTVKRDVSWFPSSFFTLEHPLSSGPGGHEPGGSHRLRGDRDRRRYAVPRRKASCEDQGA